MTTQLPTVSSTSGAVDVAQAPSFRRYSIEATPESGSVAASETVTGLRGVPLPLGSRVAVAVGAVLSIRRTLSPPVPSSAVPPEASRYWMVVVPLVPTGIDVR